MNHWWCVYKLYVSFNADGSYKNDFEGKEVTNAGEIASDLK